MKKIYLTNDGESLVYHNYCSDDISLVSYGDPIKIIEEEKNKNEKKYEEENKEYENFFFGNFNFD